MLLLVFLFFFSLEVIHGNESYKQLIDFISYETWNFTSYLFLLTVLLLLLLFFLHLLLIENNAQLKISI